ncbi:hypothetical protein ACJJTC_013366 [Scirpophaga incertulas]
MRPGFNYHKPKYNYHKMRRVAPQFSIPPPPRNEVSLGGNVTLKCVAFGSPMPTVKWRKGATKWITPEDNPPLGLNTLRLENITESSNYTCEAASVLGVIEAVAEVKVQSLPGAPTEVKASEVTATTVRLAWTYAGPEDPQYYVIQYKPKYANQAFSEISGVVTRYYSVTNLSPYTEYEMYVIAVNNIGRGPPSAPTAVITGETEPGSAPRNVQVRPLSSSTMVIQWDEPETPNGQVTGYKIYYTTDSSQPLQSWHSQMMDNNHLTTISELTPHTVYTIRVQAYTTVGPGPISPPVQVKTQQGVPSQPSNLMVSDVGETTVMLTWRRPVHAGDNIVSYELYWNDTYAKQNHKRRVPIVEFYRLTGLYPNTLYYIWLAARSQRGEGATTPPIAVRTKQYVPGAPPLNVTAVAVSPTAVRVSWQPPPAERANGRIAYYKLLCVEAGRGDSEATVVKLNRTSFLLDELRRWTEYRIWVLAGTSVGDGPASYPVTVRTHEDVPGEPQDVKVNIINSTAVNVTWKPPHDKDKHGIIRGYHVHLQELNEDNGYLNEPLRKGDGDRTPPLTFKTPGGVPVRPVVTLKILERDPIVSIELEWTAPIQTFGELKGYRLRYKIEGENFTEEHTSVNSTTRRFTDLEKGVNYEFRIAGINHIGVGQDGVKIFRSPEGPPKGPPRNITHNFQTPDIISIKWVPPTRADSSGVIKKYDVQFYKRGDQASVVEKFTNLTKIVFTGLEEDAHYIYKVRAYTDVGPGPYSKDFTIHTERDIGRAPMSVKAVATSESGVEVWWETFRTRKRIIGYVIFYSMAPVEDLDEWQQKSVHVTHSADLENLEKFAEYAIAVAAKSADGLGRLSEKVTVKVRPEEVPLHLRAQDVSTHSMTLSWSPPVRLNPVSYKITYKAIKEFVDSLGMTQTQEIPKKEIIIKKDRTSYSINDLSPFTTYSVNVSALPNDDSYRPPTKITVTTQMAAPKPMVKPDFYGVVDNEVLVILPQASEEYGPISHYYLVVVPDDKAHNQMVPDIISIARYARSASWRGASRPDPNLGNLDPEITKKPNGPNEAGMVWIIGPIIAALMLSMCLVFVFILKRKRQPCKTPDQAAVTRPLMSADVGFGAPSDPVEMRRLNFQTPAMISHPPIPISELGEHIERLKTNDNLKFSQEYESIEPGQQFTWDHSNMEVNKPKNRYANVIAYDHSRVILQPIDGILGSDYINANYCDGYRKHNADDDKTRGEDEDQMRPVLAESRERVVRHDVGDDRGSAGAGHVLHPHVPGDAERVGPSGARSSSCSSRRGRTTACPTTRRRSCSSCGACARSTRARRGPLVVHCSAGVGRTGCFVVIDSMLERARHERTVDIYGHVTCLRAQRNYMVQTEDQYIFIHDALLEAVVCGDTEVPARNLQAHIQKLLRVDPMENITGMELEFKKLANMKADSSRFVSASLPCNKHKNRLVHILPFESTRVCLSPRDGSDYINASFVDGYRYRAAYIATQGPLSDTTDDFWRMLWEHNSTIIVMLTKLKEMGREKCHQYWPSDRSVRYQCFVVDPIAEYNMPQYILREFKVTDARDGASRTVRQFQFTDWPEQGVPKNSEGFIDFLGQVHKTKEQFGQDGPITVHCSAGVGRTGVFITLSTVLERMQYEGVLDVFQTVRTLRTQRPAMVQAQDQYEFCYRAALEYLGSFDHYAN